MLLRGKRLRPAPADPINTPATSPMPSQKSQLPATRPATIPSTAPSTNPMNEIFFIAFLHHLLIVFLRPASWLYTKIAGPDYLSSATVPLLMPYPQLSLCRLRDRYQREAQEWVMALDHQS